MIHSFLVAYNCNYVKWNLIFVKCKKIRIPLDPTDCKKEKYTYILICILHYHKCICNVTYLRLIKKCHTLNCNCFSFHVFNEISFKKIYH